MKVRLLNFKEYLGRTDIKNPQWFAMDNAFLTRTEHFEKLTIEAVVSLVYIACESTKQKRAELEISERHVSIYCRMPFSSFVTACEILSDLKLIEVTRTDHVRDPYVLRTDAENLNSQNLCTTRKEDKEGGEGAQPADVPSASTTTYEFFDQPKKKPKPEELPRLAQIWNAHAHQSLPRVKLCGTSRRRHATNRWKEHPNEEFWIDVIARINRSDFCLGKTKGDRPWRADFDWLVRPDTAAKVVEGKYENREPGGSPNPPQKSYWARTLTEGGSDADPK